MKTQIINIRTGETNDGYVSESRSLGFNYLFELTKAGVPDKRSRLTPFVRWQIDGRRTLGHHAVLLPEREVEANRLRAEVEAAEQIYQTAKLALEAHYAGVRPPIKD